MHEEGTALQSLEDLDRRYVFHPFTSIRDHLEAGPLMIVEGKGCRLVDSQGNT